MRVLPAAVAAVLMAGLSAPLALAEPATTRPSADARASDQAFREATSTFRRKMGDMYFDLSRTRNLNETRAVAARYQVEADALADRIEARQAAGETTGRRYRNAASIRELPDQARRAVDRARLSDGTNALPLSVARRAS